MIKQLDINYFRSISKASLEFSDGVNVLIGLPDAGKSNVLRSLSWVLNNRPLGKRMLSDFTDEPSFVEAYFVDEENTSKIGLLKSKTSSKYFFNNKELNAIGSGVPEEISTIANMTELNFQRQLDQPFLITLSAGETAKVFNKITRLDKSDEVISAITTDLNSTNKKLKQAKIEKESLEKLLSDLAYIDQMEKDMEQIIDNDYKLQNILEDINYIEELINKVKSIKIQEKHMDKEIDTLSEILSSMEKDYENILSIESSLKSVSDDISQLSNFINKVQLNKKEFDREENALKNKAQEYKNFLSTIDICPFCSYCKEPIKKHDLDSVLKGIVE
jgi:DNA repair ATPase RecN